MNPNNELVFLSLPPSLPLPLAHTFPLTPRPHDIAYLRDTCCVARVGAAVPMAGSRLLASAGYATAAAASKPAAKPAAKAAGERNPLPAPTPEPRNPPSACGHPALANR